MSRRLKAHYACTAKISGRRPCQRRAKGDPLASALIRPRASSPPPMPYPRRTSASGPRPARCLLEEELGPARKGVRIATNGSSHDIPRLCIPQPPIRHWYRGSDMDMAAASGRRWDINAPSSLWAAKQSSTGPVAMVRTLDWKADMDPLIAGLSAAVVALVDRILERRARRRQRCSASPARRSAIRFSSTTSDGLNHTKPLPDQTP
jgi:hypothetical protein